jgi:hypothetical protein
VKLSRGWRLDLRARQEDLTLDSWITRIAAATTDEHVVAMAREFLAGLPLGLVSGLPAPCRPPEMSSAQDVSSYAFVLMHRCVAKDCDAALLGMNSFFAAASQRVSVILTPQGRFTSRPPIEQG